MSIREKAVPFESDTENVSAGLTDALPPTLALPDEPLIRVRPAGPWSAIELKEVWAYHELFYFLIWRDLKVRYRQTVLGSVWVILQPLLMTLVFTIFLGRLVRVPSDGVPYSVFAYAGLLPWTFLTNAVLSSSHSLVGSAPLITKVYFPRMLVPGAAVMVRLVDFTIASVILLAMLFYYGYIPGWRLLIFPALALELTIVALGLGLWSAALNVRYRDIGTLLPVGLQLWMFISPIIYPSTIVPERWRLLYALNPLVGIIEGMRASLFNLPFDWNSIGVSVIMTLLLLVYAVYSFRRAEEGFADVV
ncbi:MAG TPA: ABC transporter permease [Pyrinomonadaceae bacterium]|jgi:lipopolysaccharide transport system permease protein|nr:ABC transporter permease [Pyrinomonadaceae bacterium]